MNPQREAAPKCYAIRDSRQMVWVLSGNSLIASPLSSSIKPGSNRCYLCPQIQTPSSFHHQTYLQGSRDNIGKDTFWNLVGIHTCINLDVSRSCSMGTLDQWGIGVGRKKWKSSCQYHHLRKNDKVFPSMWTNIGMPGRMQK
ncbi:interleukin-36 beta-like [Symphalangus syndactylus]|uniref:interleukin-36 beta-like n=1 Tax=Symphalangus syndactylus TaxID=9590 RepID=UPI002441D32C|nr:interleukin-36 beta-like [Symphalangus syndactylus]